MVLSLMYPKKTDTSLRFIVEISIYTYSFHTLFLYDKNSNPTPDSKNKVLLYRVIRLNT
jgi:hypothetical protein